MPIRSSSSTKRSRSATAVKRTPAVAKANKKQKKGFTILEILLAVSLAGLMITALNSTYLVIKGSGSNVENKQQASLIAQEGISATQNIGSQSWSNLQDGTYGLVVTASGTWSLSTTTPDTINQFTRQIIIETVGSSTKKIISTVTWPSAGGGSSGGSSGSGGSVSGGGSGGSGSGSVSVSTFVSNPISSSGAGAGGSGEYGTGSGRSGLLVYANLGSAADVISYRILDGATHAWSSAMPVADVDANSTNRMPRSMHVYSSPLRTEKVLLSKHFDGTKQYVYGQVFNGVTWGNVVLLSSWTNSVSPYAQGFAGTYLANGEFMAVYSDNTNAPKMRVWNGAAWTAQYALPDKGTIPMILTAKARPGTNEVMVAYLGANFDTISSYNDGHGYATANWSINTYHATNGTSNSSNIVDFVWSAHDSTKGAIFFTDLAKDRAPNIMTFQANGVGGGTWGASVDSYKIQASRLVSSFGVMSGNSADRYVMCTKYQSNGNGSEPIMCQSSDQTPLWTLPHKQILTQHTTPGFPKSYDIAFEGKSGDGGLAVFSDNSSQVQAETYLPGLFHDARNNGLSNCQTDDDEEDVSNPHVRQDCGTDASWSGRDAYIHVGTMTGTVSTVKIVPAGSNSNDIMALMSDANRNLATAVWNGEGNVFYPASVGGLADGRGFTLQNAVGSATTDVWFDFAWD